MKPLKETPCGLFTATTEQLKAEARETPAGKLLVRYGFEPWDTESSARLVAEKAAAEIQELVEVLREIRDWTGPHYASARALQGFQAVAREILNRLAP